MKIKPLLTIGIPTYNRSHLLKGLLECLIAQVELLVNRSIVQIVVSDNNSIDNTKSIIEEFTTYEFVEYYCNSQNIGACNNVLKIGNEIAEGDFCWILGDDDLLRDGAIQYVLDKIATHNDIDIIYMNQTYENEAERASIGKNLPVVESKKLCNTTNDHLLPNAQPIVGYSIHSALFTSIPSVIFRTQVWKGNFIGYQPDKPFSSLKITFPHTVILSKSLITKKVYYVSFPYLAFFVGAQEWLGEWPYLNFIRVLELSDLFEKLGASKKFLFEYRQRVFGLSEEIYFQFLTGSIDRYKKSFNLISYIRRYYDDQTFIGLNRKLKNRVIKFYAKKFLSTVGLKKANVLESKD